jgi:hypothetical protein
MSTPKSFKDELIEQVQNGTMDPMLAVSQFSRLTPTQARIGRVFVPANTEDRVTQYTKARVIREQIKQQNVPFLFSEFMPDFYLSQGLVLVGAEPGKSKSTTCGNLLAGFLTHSDKNAIVVSNEEAMDAVYERTACVLLSLNYTEFYHGKYSQKVVDSVVRCVQEDIIPRCIVVDEGEFDMSFLEDVQSVLESGIHNNVGIVFIDYLQVITQSRKNPDLEAFQISKKLGFYLKAFGKSNGIPVVCFAQLNKGDEHKGMAERVQNDKTFYNHAFIAIEVCPDFETLTTTFIVQKDRFNGCSGKKVVLDFKGGRFVRPF